MSKTLAGLLAIAISVALFVSPGEAEKFVFAWTAVSSLNSPFWVMNDMGFLKQEGFAGDMVYIASSPTAARAMPATWSYPALTQITVGLSIDSVILYSISIFRSEVNCPHSLYFSSTTTNSPL